MSPSSAVASTLMSLAPARLASLPVYLPRLFLGPSRAARSSCFLVLSQRKPLFYLPPLCPQRKGTGYDIHWKFRLIENVFNWRLPRVKLLKCKRLHRNKGCRGGTKYEGRQLKVEAGALPDAPCNDSQSWAMTGWKPKQLRDDGDRDRATGKVTELQEVRSSTLCWFSLGITFNTLNLHAGWDEERWRVTESNREQRSTLLYDADHLPDNNMRDSLG